MAIDILLILAKVALAIMIAWPVIGCIALVVCWCRWFFSILVKTVGIQELSYDDVLEENVRRYNESLCHNMKYELKGDGLFPFIMRWPLMVHCTNKMVKAAKKEYNID